MTSVSKEDELEIYKLVLKGHRQTDIAKQFDISQPLVSYIYKKITERNDRDLAVSSALDFVAVYSLSKDYLTMKLFELEIILQETQDPKEKAKVIMDQVTVQEKILNLCSQGKFMQSVQEYGYAKVDEITNVKSLEDNSK